MSKTTDEMKAYLQRKKDRRDDHARNVDICLNSGDGEKNYEQAQYHLRQANRLQDVIWAIEHCLRIVERNNDS